MNKPIHPVVQEIINECNARQFANVHWRYVEAKRLLEQAQLDNRFPGDSHQFCQAAMQFADAFGI